MAGIRNRTVELKNRLSEYVRMVRSASAVVAWLPGGPSGLAAREALATAEAITASDSPRQRRRGAGPPDQMHAPSPGPGEAD